MLASALIDSLFLLCPASELPLLDVSARLDMLDYYAAEMEAKGANVMGGTSVMEEKGDSLIRLRLTEVSTWEMRLLDDGIIRCQHTISAAEMEPRVNLSFYSKDWAPIRRKK